MSLPRILCTGDTHLGKGRGLYPERLDEQAAVWASILKLANDRSCDLIIHAGDVFDRNQPDPAVLDAFVRPTVEIPGPPILCVTGNVHDVSHPDTPAAAEVVALTSERLTVVRTAQMTHFGDAAFVCLPWAPVTRFLADIGVGDRTAALDQARGALLDVARMLRARVANDGKAVLVGHWSVQPASLPTGLDVSMLREVVLPLAELERMGWDAIILGHIHLPQELATQPTEPECPAFYVGSPMPLDFGEAGYVHGVWILEPWEQRMQAGIDINGWNSEFVPLSYRPFVTLDAVLQGNPPGFPWAAADSIDGCVVRARYTGTEEQVKALEPTTVRSALLAAGAHAVVDVAPTVIRDLTERAHVDTDIHPLDALQQWLASVGVNGDTAVAALAAAPAYYLEGAA